MKKIFFLCFVFSQCVYAEVKISQLPVLTGSSVGTNDTLPFLSISHGETAQLKISELLNVPSLFPLSVAKGGTGVTTSTGTGSVVLSNSASLTGTTTMNSSAAGNILSLNVTGYNNAGLIRFLNLPSSGFSNWIIGAQNNLNNGFEITPSTTVDGSTFTSPALKIFSSGSVQIPGALTVTGGTTLSSVTTGTLTEAGGTSQYWNDSTNNWNGSLTPISSLSINSSYPGGYDPILIGRMSTTTGNLKPVYGIGAVGTAGWADGTLASQIANFYIVLRDAAGLLQRRFSITPTGTAIFSNDINVGNNTTSDSNLGTISSVGLNQYYVGSFTMTFTGPWASNQTMILNYQKIGRQVTLTATGGTLGTTSNTGSVGGISSTTNLPSALYPATDTYIPVVMVDNSADTTGFVRIRNAASIQFFKLPSTNFTNGNFAGVEAFCVTYFSAN